MLLKGRIKAIRPSVGKDGKQREFTTRDNKVFVCYEVDVDVPSIRKDGTEFADEFILECNVEKGSPTPYSNYIGTGEKLDINAFFSRREYQGKFFAQSRISSITKRVE